MDLNKLTSLLKDFGAYQDVEIEGTTIKKGTRDCQSRWQMINPHIKHNSVIIDMGSDLGFFASKIGEEFKDTLVISIEQGEKGAEIQKEVLKLKNLTNVILCNHRFDLATLEGLIVTVEGIDTLIALSVFHHQPLETTRKMINLISKIIPELIIELPIITGTGNCTGREYSEFGLELHNYYKHLEVIGETILSPGQKRVIYRAWNDTLSREPLSPTFSFNPNPAAMHLVHRLEYKDKKWTRTKKRDHNSGWLLEDAWIQGFSAWTLLYWKPIYPEAEWWEREADKAYRKIQNENDKIGDVRPQNLIITSKGWVAIDYLHKAPPNMVERDIKKTCQVFKDMNIHTAIKLFSPHENN